MDNIRYADPFYGNYKPELKKPEGIAAKWFFLKARTGNTHPGAQVPFGMVSACAYTGGYPTGYSPYWVNSYAFPPEIQDADDMYAMGFSHFHHSGTGFIDEFYNYLIVTPAGGAQPKRFQRFSLRNERAVPGMYSCSLGGIPSYITASNNSVIERFDMGQDGHIAFDLGLNGLVNGSDMMAPLGQAEKIELISGGFNATIKYAQRLHISVLLPDCKKLRVSGGDRVIAPVGAGRVHVYIGFSFASLINAQRNANAAMANGYDDMYLEARDMWKERLDAIDIQADEETKHKFYSCMYHSLVKPVFTYDDGPHANEDGLRLPTCEYSTMWDIVKTELPLIMMLYKDMAQAVAKTKIDSMKTIGLMPIAMLLTEPDNKCDMQAMALGCLTIYDAYVRGAQGIDWNEALDAMIQELSREKYSAFFETGIADEYPSHTIDAAVACHTVSLLAWDLGKKDIAEKYALHAKSWINAYDSSTGLCLENGKYYEGTNWNYSFRLLPEMEKRMALSKDFLSQLDYFFGFDEDAPDAVQMEKAEDYSLVSSTRPGFEGFNNETDMETPYAYIYLGRPDRLAQIVRSCEKHLFGLGRGALCGNNDSGGLTSVYVSNALGIFPVSGQDLILLGCPLVSKAQIKLANGKELTICVEGNLEDSYPEKIFFNGESIDGYMMKCTELMRGGELRFVMK